MNLSSKSVLVTGGAGFIGSSLVRELLREDAEVTVLDNFSAGDPSHLAGLDGSLEVVEGDIRDSSLTSLLERKEVDCVFNLAAEPYIPYCYDRPAQFFEVNANGTLNLLLACKEAGVERILHYSSSEVYGSAKHVPMDEEHPTLPLSTYAVSKLAADRLCFTMYHEQEVPVIILRQFNCYGPRETYPYIIPELISQLSKGPDLQLGNIKARRDFTYVEDAVRGAIELMKCDRAVGEVVNLGSGIDYSVEELSHIIGELMGYDRVNIEIAKERLRPLDVERLQCDYSKARELCGYRPKTSIAEGIERTIDWFRENNERWIWEVKIAPSERIWRKDDGC
ncbi:MAG: NAD-dependent epimerase/dehydratase family protein [Methanobacteriota archaeon]|nr:MAG: NAD-dependent epimerase/dehydratase family protein [Euryarchaeota archaeon]